MSEDITKDVGVLDKLWSWITKAQSSIGESEFSFLNFSLGDHGAGDIAMFIINVIFSIVTAVVGVFVVMTLAQYFFRWVYNKYRRFMCGKIVWSEVIYEGIISDNETNNSVGQMDNMANIMKNTSTGINFGFQFNRPRYLIMIRLNPEDEQAHMYIGMDEKHYDENVLSSWAAGANCSIEPVDFDDIGFVSQAPMTLVREDYDTANFNDSPNNSTVGGVISRLQSSSGIKEGASVIVSYEPMSNREEHLMKKKILSDNVAEGGDAAKLDLTARNVNIFLSKSPCRGTITSYSDNGDYSISNSVLRTVSSNMPSIGTRTSSVRYETLHRRAGIFCIIPSLFLTLLGLVGFVPLWMPLTLVVISMIAVIGLPIMSSQWMSMAAQSEANPPIPAFTRISLRRTLALSLHKLIPINKFKFSGTYDQSQYVPEPSQREVIPLYQTSMMQFASMPRDGKGVSNISSQAIPQVSMSSTVIQDIRGDIAKDKVALLGTSVRTFDPVMFTVKDLNNGIAMAGNRGSGKTNALSNLYAGISHLSRNSNEYTFTPFWLETKSEDLDGIISNVKTYNPLVLMAHNRDTEKRVCFEGPRFEDGADIKDIKRNINTIISGMEKLWGAGSFGPRSKQVAHSSLTIAMLLSRQERNALGISSRVTNPDRPNIMEVMNLLIGSDPTLNLVDTSRKVIAPGGGKNKSEGILEKIANGYKAILINPQKKAERIAKHGEREVMRMGEITPALDQLISFYNTTEALNPLRNKIPVLASSSGLWETVTHSGKQREEVPLYSFIKHEGPVIVDLTHKNSSISSEDIPMFSMFFHYMLWSTIKDNCAGWAKQNKFIPIFIDELKNITGTSNNKDESQLGDIVAEVSDIGRSYGASHSVGFQRYTQLPPETVATVRGMTSKLYFSLEDAQDRTVVMNQLGEKTRYAQENINSMPTGYCIADLKIGGVRRNAFTMKVPYFPTLVGALNSSSTVEDAFEKLLYEEKEKISEDKKKKAEDFQSSNKIYDDSTNYIDDHHDDMMDNYDDGNDDSGLTWA